MSIITSLHAREIFDLRGIPTVEVELETENGKFISSVPSGSSKGFYEAKELRDNDEKRLYGKGVLKAVNNVNSIIAKELIGKNVLNQKELDDIMINLDGTPDKSRLGANSILACSMCIARAAAASKKIPLFKYLAELTGHNQINFPIPFFNIITGGQHANNGFALQEIMIYPTKVKSFKEAYTIGIEIFHCMKKIIEEKYGKEWGFISISGGFSPPVYNWNEAFDLVMEAINKTGNSGKIELGIDSSASEFYIKSLKKYDIGFKYPQDLRNNNQLKNSDQLIEEYLRLIEKYPLINFEDPFDENDWDAWIKFNKILNEKNGKIQVTGDDLTVTNPQRLKIAINKKACNSVIIKMSQIGTLTETFETIKIAQDCGFKVIASHRSGETEDNFIAHLSVGLNCYQIKTSPLCRTNNELLRLEDIIS